jgi:hypothetical protein
MTSGHYKEHIEPARVLVQVEGMVASGDAVSSQSRFPMTDGIRESAPRWLDK